jgi:tRNA C32,U32 (ribose-2'-O)-methylase TrmJ
VRPPADRDSEARKLAAGAHRVLEKAHTFSTLRDAVSDFGLVIGTSRHQSRWRKNFHTPRVLAEKGVSPITGLPSFGSGNGLENDDINVPNLYPYRRQAPSRR